MRSSRKKSCRRLLRRQSSRKPDSVRITETGDVRAVSSARTARITRDAMRTETAMRRGTVRRASSVARTGTVRTASSAATTETARTVSSVRTVRITRDAMRTATAVRRETARTARITRDVMRTGMGMHRGTVRKANSAARTGTVRTITETDTIVRDREIRKDKQDTMTISLKDNERVDDLQRNGYHIIQNPEKFCFGMDAVLLTGFAHAGENDRLLDLGTGTGIIPLLMEAKYHCAHLTGLEIQPESADMAARSVALNHLTDKIDIVTGDIKEADTYFPSASFDCVTCNPPYMIGQHGIANPDAPKAIARHEILCTFEDVARQTAKLLKPGGHFFLVHRPFRLAELMGTLMQYKLEPKRMQLVYPYVDKEPNMVLLEAVRGGKPRMTVEKPLIVFEKPGVYMSEISDLYGF